MARSAAAAPRLAFNVVSGFPAPTNVPPLPAMKHHLVPLALALAALSVARAPPAPASSPAAPSSADAADAAATNPLWHEQKVKNYLPHMSWPEVQDLLTRT